MADLTDVQEIDVSGYVQGVWMISSALLENPIPELAADTVVGSMGSMLF
jgi:hypothetical protein